MSKPQKPFLKTTGPLTFYSPRSERIFTSPENDKEKTRKFLRIHTEEDLLPNGSLTDRKTPTIIPSLRMFSPQDDMIREFPDLLVDHKYKGQGREKGQKSMYQLEANQITGDSLSTIKTNDNDSIETHTRNLSTQELIDRTLGRNSKEEVNKFYKAANEFRKLRTKTAAEEEGSRNKFSEDQRFVTMTQFSTIKKDISHVLDKKSPRTETTLNTSSLPEIKHKHNQKFAKFIEEVHEKDLFHSKASYISTDKDVLFEHHIPESKFFKPSTATENRALLHAKLNNEIRTIYTPFQERRNTDNVSTNNSTDRARPSSPTTRSSPTKNRPVTQGFQTLLTNLDFSESSYIHSLRKELPTVFTTASVGRQEVLILGNWLMKTIDGIEKETEANLQEKFKKADEVYSICISELIRQVSCECIERAELLMRVWKAYTDLSQDIITERKKVEIAIEMKAEEERNKLHEMYKAIIDAKDKKLQEEDEKRVEMEKIMEQLKEKMSTAMANKETTFSENQRLKNAIEKYKKTLQNVMQEHRDMSYKYEKLKKEFTNQADDNKDLEELLKKHNLDLSSDEDDGTRQPAAFGVIRQKIIRKADKSTEYVDPYPPPIKPPPEDNSTQTYLSLLDPRFNRIIRDMETLNDVLMQEIIKDRLILEGELLENMAENEEIGEAELKRIQVLLKADKIRRRHQGEPDDISLIASEDNTPYRSIADLSHDGTPSSARGTSTSGLRFRDAIRRYNPSSTKDGESSKIRTMQDIGMDSIPSIPSPDSTKKHRNTSLEESPNQNITNSSSRNLIDLKKSDSLKDRFLSPGSQSGDQSPRQVKPFINLKLLDGGDGSPTSMINNRHGSRTQTNAPKGNSDHDSPDFVIEDEKTETKNNMLAPPKTLQLNKGENREITEENEGANVENERTENKSNMLVPPKALALIKGANKTIAEENEEATENGSPSSSPKRDRKGFNFTLNNADSSSTPQSKAGQLQNVINPFEIEKDDRSNKGSTPSSSLNASIMLLPEKRSGSKKITPSIVLNRDKSESLDESTPNLSQTQNSLQHGRRPSMMRRNNKGLSGFATTVVSKTNEKWLNLKKNIEKGEIINSKDKAKLKNNPGAFALNVIANLSTKAQLQSIANSLAASKSLKKSGSTDQAEKKIIVAFEKQEQKIVQFMNMYKVERKKQEELNMINRELEKRISKDQALLNSLSSILESIKDGGSLQSHQDQLQVLNRFLEQRNKEMEKLNISKSKVTLNPSLLETTRDEGRERSLDRGKTIEISKNEPAHTRVVYKGNFLLVNPVLARKHLILERRSNPAQNIISKLRANFNAKLAKIKSLIPVSSLLKQITNFYIERIYMSRENPAVRDQDMCTFVYRQFINTFGFQKFAIQKFTKFAASVRKHSNVGRIGKFAKLMGMLDEGHNYKIEETKQYMAGLEYLLSNTTIGASMNNSESEKKHFVPWLRAAEYVKIFGEKRMTPKEIMDFNSDCEKLKIADPTNRNQAGIIDVDAFLDKIVIRFKVLMNKGKEAYISAFKGCDLDGDNKIAFVEFAAFFKALEPEKFEEKKCEEIFINNCDIIEGDEMAISQENFLNLCFEVNLFQENKQNAFIGIHRETELEKVFNQLKEKWQEDKEKYTKIMDEKKNTIPQEVFSLWTRTIKSIDEGLKEDSPSVKKGTLIKHKILTNDLKISLE